jgi:sugar lactone lactonase YvrE
VEIPCRRASCVAFGGENRDKLFITSAAFGNEENQASGKTFCVNTNTRGASVYKYKE